MQNGFNLVEFEFDFLIEFNEAKASGSMTEIDKFPR